MAGFGAASVLLCMPGMSQAGTVEPGKPALTRAVTQYLSDHGDLCVGKFTWPRVVTAKDRETGTNDAVQLPVLERLGLVESAEVAASGPARRYSLTAKGRRYYLEKKRMTLGLHGNPVEQDRDLCVARLSLDKVIKWTPPEQEQGHLETLVNYTYHIRSADWMSDPEARKVFPVVDRIIRGQGNLLMAVTVQLQDGKWVPVLPGQ
jgi:DNA-binding PadR family transcriptional regulator